MNGRYVSPDKLSTVFNEFLKQKDVLFVFSTDVVKNSWMEWIVTHEKESGVRAVSDDDFIAWDSFKGRFADDSTEGRTTVPSLLRKLFVRDLIQKNSEEHFLKKIISPEFAGDASSFTDWISRILTSLEMWHSRFIKQDVQDEEDEDFLELYERYKNFLEQNNFYEPAWTMPDFSRIKNTVVLIYPEILEDYGEYYSLFERSECILPIYLPEESEARPACYRYSDSRKELRRTILQMKNLVEQKKCRWTDIALSVPNMEVYRPYLERELKKYEVPFVIRAGVPLTVNSAGSIFADISSCYNDDFSYNSVRAVLLNEMIPWKESLRTVKENLIREGCAMRCICPYYEISGEGKIKHDVFEEALRSTSDRNEAELAFYRQFKKDITAICTAGSFYALRQAWFEFRINFIEESKFSVEANKILSRCVTSLNELIEIENDYFESTGLSIAQPFDFFLSELNSKSYTMQNKTAGLSVYPYRLTAAACFKYQFIIDASQKNLEVTCKPLSFLNECKRERLNLLEEDKKFNASAAFIRLYAKSAPEGTVQFSYAENTFEGFAIAHNFLNVVDEEEPLKELDSQDFILDESKWFLSGGKGKKFSFTEGQKDQFNSWKKINGSLEKSEPELLEGCIKNMSEARLENFDGDKTKPVLTQKDMKNYFPCQRKWIYMDVLGLREDSLDTQLLGAFDEGNINHEIIEHFLNHCIKNRNGILPLVNNDGIFEDEKEIVKLLCSFADEAINRNMRAEYSRSPLSRVVLNAAKETIADNILNFLHSFCMPFEGKGFGNFSITAVEQWFNCVNETCNFSGKIDCILNNGEQFYIVDFKTGKTPTKKQSIVNEEGRLDDFQIAMYMELWNSTHPEHKMDNALFYSIRELTPVFVVSASSRGREQIVSPAEYEKTLEAMKSYAETFCAKTSGKDFTPSVNDDEDLNKIDIYSDCASCSFKNVCRTLFTVSGRTLEK